MEISIHCLDVDQAVRGYLLATASFRKTDSLFSPQMEPVRVFQFLYSTIPKWLKQTTIHAYVSVCLLNIQERKQYFFKSFSWSPLMGNSSTPLYDHALGTALIQN